MTHIELSKSKANLRTDRRSDEKLRATALRRSKAGAANKAGNTKGLKEDGYKTGPDSVKTQAQTKAQGQRSQALGAA